MNSLWPPKTRSRDRLPRWGSVCETTRPRLQAASVRNCHSKSDSMKVENTCRS